MADHTAPIPGRTRVLGKVAWAIWVLCPGGGECDGAISPGCFPSSLSARVRQIDSDVVWSLRARLADELAKDQLPSLLLAFLRLCCKLAVKCVVRLLLIWDDEQRVFLALVSLALKKTTTTPLSVENVPSLYWRFNLYLSPNLSIHFLRFHRTHWHWSLSLIDNLVPEHWSLSTNEIVHRQRFQSIRER